jgi:hypothetical protein
MLDQTRTLHDLAQRIAIELDAIDRALQSALGHAIAAGGLLIEAKGKVRHGRWGKWLTAHKIPPRTATHYMELARRRDVLCDQNGNVLPISVSGGLHEFENGTGGDWPRLAWRRFADALKTALSLPELGPPRPAYIVKAFRAGKTPGLDAEVLRKVAALLIRYADAIEAVEHISERIISAA